MLFRRFLPSYLLLVPAIFRGLMPSPEVTRAREASDALLTQCGWTVQNRSTINLSVACGVAISTNYVLRSECLP